ncbi:MAG: glycosyltransferase [Acidobacteriota bacterium]|nr:glycosyltransferase [Acidobacteriota bacterium]
MTPRIAHILPFPDIAGTEIAALRLAQAARQRGWESMAFCVGPRVCEMFESEGFRALTYPEIQPSYRHPRQYWSESFNLARRFRQEGVSLIHCADLLAAEHVSLAALLARKRLVSHVRNRAEFMSRREQSFLWPVERFVFVSENTWQTFACRVSARRGTVLYDGIAPRPELEPAQRAVVREAVRREFQIPQGRKIIGMVGRISSQKDYATLVRAAAQVVRKHDVCFALVGDYMAPFHREVYQATRQLIASLDMEGRFIFTGFRTDTERLVAAFDIFVLSTHHEGFPLVILEAMAGARPVAATAVDGIPEIVQHGVTGMLHGKQDHNQLAANLTKLLEDPAMATRLGRAAREQVAGKFSEAAFTERVAGFYSSLRLPAVAPEGGR